MFSARLFYLSFSNFENFKSLRFMDSSSFENSNPLLEKELDRSIMEEDLSFGGEISREDRSFEYSNIKLLLFPWL